MKSKTLKTLAIIASVVGLTSCGHTCEFSTDYSKNDTEHWHECECGEKENVTEHEFNIPGDIVTEKTCTTDGEQIYLCVCGAQTKVTLPSEGHSYSQTWSHNEEQHWKECSCGDKSELANHEFNIPGEVTKAKTCTENGEQKYLCECGEFTLVTLEATGHIDTDGDITCDAEGCTVRVLPENNSTITAALANLIGMTVSSSNKYYVRGTVVNLVDAKNGEFYIDDGTTPIFVRLPYMNGVLYSQSGVRVCEGDTVQIYGNVTKYTSQNVSKAAFTGSNTDLTILEHEHHYSDATCTEPATCACLGTTGEPLGHQDKDGDSLCDACKLNLALQEVVMYFDTTDASADKGVLDTTNYTHTFENDEMNVVLSKGSASSINTAAYAQLRPRNGNDLTFTTKTTKLISMIVLTSTSETYASKILPAFSSLTGVTATQDGVSITLELAEPVTSLTGRFNASTRIVSAAIYLVK